MRVRILTNSELKIVDLYPQKAIRHKCMNCALVLKIYNRPSFFSDNKHLFIEKKHSILTLSPPESHRCDTGSSAVLA